ncbi:MAG: hypothetical protein H7263_09900 [Candidatus Sericytochromatia bacterium]|nr:hypothetical protein [Candidatus Sericytochromatia bacterium]
MEKNLVNSLFAVITLSLLVSCSSADNITSTDLNNNSVNISSNVQKPIKNDISNPRVMSLSYATQIAKALDINNDGSVDATEAPIQIGDLKSDSLSNYTQDLSGTPSTPLKISDIAAKLFVNDGQLSMIGTRISEKNRAKVLGNLSSVLAKDSIGDSGKIYGYSSTVGYFTSKTTIKVCSMDASFIAKKITDQFNISSSDKVNGKPAQMANGGININAGYATIDGSYKSRLVFTQYDIFNSGLPFFGSHTISDAASKIVK